jgi:hypothetical protein
LKVYFLGKKLEKDYENDKSTQGWKCHSNSSKNSKKKLKYQKSLFGTFDGELTHWLHCGRRFSAVFKKNVFFCSQQQWVKCKRMLRLFLEIITGCDLGGRRLNLKNFFYSPTAFPSLTNGDPSTTVTIEQWALIKHCLWMTKMATHSKIVDPLYIRGRRESAAVGLGSI